jgi:hypothetical protein
MSPFFHETHIPLTTYSARGSERFWSIAIGVGISGKNFNANDKIDSALVNGVLIGTAVIFGFIGFQLREITVSAIEKFFLDSVLFKHKSEKEI